MESCVGTQVRVISNGWGSIPYAIGHATKNVWFAMASDDPGHSPSENTPEVHKNMDPMTVQELQEFYDHDDGFVWVVMSGVSMGLSRDLRPCGEPERTCCRMVCLHLSGSLAS